MADPQIQTMQAMADGLRVLSRSLTTRAESIVPAGRQDLLEAKAHCNAAIGLINRAIHRTGER